MNEIEFRSIGVQDIALVQPLWEKLRDFHRSRTEHFQAYYDGMRFEKRIQKFLDPALNVRIELCCRVEGGEAVGYCIASLNANREGEIDSLFVDVHFRGRGIAGTFMGRAIEWLNAEGAGEIRVKVAAGNAGVLHFYERFGLYPAYMILKMGMPE